MDKPLQNARKLLIQDRLDSLNLRLEELGKDVTNLSTDRFSKQCISCMKDIRSLAYGCLIENIDRFDRSEYDNRMKETLRVMRFDVNKNNGIELDSHPRVSQPLMAIGERIKGFMALKFALPPAKLCLTPYNAHDIFEELATNLKSLAIEELKCREYDLIKTSAPRDHDSSSNNQLGPPLAPGSSFGRPVVDTTPEEEASKKAMELWVEKQNDMYQTFLQLPVTSHIVSVSLSHYEDTKVHKYPLPSGLTLLRLHYDNGVGEWCYSSVIPGNEENSAFPFKKGDVEVLTATRNKLRQENLIWGMALEKQVPEPHPLLLQLELHFDSIIPEEFGVVVAWRYYGSKQWMDRYGHLVSED
ncbi:hypothetical protein FBEOM_2070 [Fusarium beomiforme]|uniref:Uncharacterized protein n=1 Tax=Fusarium beomiforme TaxID=44412 RepID=A0A9P5E3Y7_9HYPO|nr:hypothetical protein FBEOM_2070 [Fusarium beomiforme]